MISLPLRAALAASAFLAIVCPAGAHTTLEAQEAAVGSTYKAVLRVGHGCDGAATLKLRVRIPDGVIAAKPMPKPGWSLETVKGDYGKTYDLHGTPVTAGVREIVWTGGLPDDHYDEFVFRAMLTGDLKAGTTLHFPVVQECGGGKADRWIEIPAEGQSAHDLKYPAPSLKLLPPKAMTH